MSKTLTQEQQRAIEAWNQPVALLAAAGSGKTTVLVQRYLSCLERGATPDRILVVTFTNEAADQLRCRISAALGEKGASEKILTAVDRESTIGTLHSFCYRLINQYGSLVGLEPIQSILSSFEFLGAFDQAYRRWFSSLTPHQLGSLLEYVSHREIKDLVKTLYQHRFLFEKQVSWLNHGTVEEAYLVLLWELAHPLVDDLSQSFARRGLFSFDDLEHYTLRMLDLHPETVKRIQDQYQYCLVDEFQDTSAIQWDILSHLCGDHPSKLFVVGDPKQSIYRFRNADYHLFLEVAQKMEQRGGSVLELTHNFRSSPALVSVINQLSTPLFQGSALSFSAMQAGKHTESALVPWRKISYPAQGKKQELVKSEIQSVVSFLKEQLATHPPEAFTLLFRVSDRMGEYAEALRLGGIPATCKKTTSLFHSYEVLDVLNYLRAVRDPLDDFTFGSFLRTRHVGFQYESLWKLTEQPGTSLYEKAKTEAQSLGWFFQLIESGETNVPRLLTELFAHSLYWPQKWETLLAVFAPLCEPPASLFDVLDRLESWTEEAIFIQTEDGTSSTPSVQLMTVHAAKGLEFPHVLLVDCLRQPPRRSPKILFSPRHAPVIQLKQDGEALECEAYKKRQEENAQEDSEEAKRVLYVALTRAMESLTLFLPEELKAYPKGSWASLLS